MAEQYYTADPTSESKPVPCAFPYRGHGLNFMTDAGVFSKGELDAGSRLLLDALPALQGDVLDLGCGWGAIGIAVAKAYPKCRVTMVDVNHRALSLCRENCQRNGVTAACEESDGMSAVISAGRTFDAIITNPPIRAGKQVIYRMFADAARSLNPGGALYLVIRKQQGAESCVKYLKTLYGEVEKLDKSGGFWVLKASEPKSQEGDSDEV
ncbi:MAG: class I SAM-dependent methyltransferase [Clostridia bacterium]|nr:class I SAM-dependent methyltransferase [Clostridia bacterium]